MKLNEIVALADDEYISEADLSTALDRPVSTLRTWSARRRGPPRTALGRAILYRVGGLKRWLESQERDYDAEREGRRGRRVA